jgi:UTP:GlnB (protein PII) uridylyltransferase
MKVMIAAALVMSSSIAHAQDAPKPDGKPTTEKKTCRSLTPTGSLMATRVCNTAAAWREFDGILADGAEQTRNVYRMTSTGIKH